MKEDLINKFHNRTAKVGVIGLGYVGVPLSLAFAKAGFQVIGFDNDNKRAELINSGKSFTVHISDEDIAGEVEGGRLRAVSEFSRVADMDALIICVPTPLSKHREPDLTFITASIESSLPYLHTGMLISLESTTYPGTTEEEILPRLRKAGFTIGTDIFVVYSPEREDPGNKSFTTGTIPKVIGGATSGCLEAGTSLYRQIIERMVQVSSTKAAELTKLLENIYRSVNIGLANEMKVVADRMGIDIWEIIDAAATKPFGFTPFYPGPGLGGHCLPIDPFYLTWKAREFQLHTHFIELAGEINRSMPDWVVGRIQDALNHNGLALKGANLLVLGLAYKKNIEDIRESPSIQIIRHLCRYGARVTYSDPYVEVIPDELEFPAGARPAGITDALLRDSDCVIIATDHDQFDYSQILLQSRLIVDTRGRYRKPDKKVIRA